MQNYLFLFSTLFAILSGIFNFFFLLNESQLEKKVEVFLGNRKVYDDKYNPQDINLLTLGRNLQGHVFNSSISCYFINT